MSKTTLFYTALAASSSIGLVSASKSDFLNSLDAISFDSFKTALAPQIKAVEDAERLYYSAMHAGHTSVHLANYLFDDEDGNAEMSADLNTVFNAASPDYKIWHGDKRKGNFCPDAAVNRACDFDEIALWDDRMEIQEESLFRVTESNNAITSIYREEIALLV
jgi:hypothetical protein